MKSNRSHNKEVGSYIRSRRGTDSGDFLESRSLAETEVNVVIAAIRFRWRSVGEERRLAPSRSLHFFLSHDSCLFLLLFAA